MTAQENLFQTPFTNESKTESNNRSVKLQKVETAAGRSLIGGLFNNNQGANVTYTDIKPEDHLKTYQF